MARPEIHRLDPQAATPGGRLAISGSGFDVRLGHVPAVVLGGVKARVVRASSRQLVVELAESTPGGPQSLAIEGVDGATLVVVVATVLTTSVHQVDSPVFDGQGRLYATLSGQRGQQTPVSVFRIGSDGSREPLVTEVGNATSLAFDHEGRLHVSSRFEGTVSRLNTDGELEKVAGDLGVACGLAFAADGELLVGDRSGSIHRVARDGRSRLFASIPPSIAAFHLAIDADGSLVVAAPTLNSCDPLYRVSPEGEVSRWIEGFGRPQGVAFDPQGRLHVVDALAGDSGVYRIDAAGQRELVVSGAGLLGVAFDPTDGAMAVCTDETIYRIAP